MATGKRRPRSEMMRVLEAIRRGHHKPHRIALVARVRLKRVLPILRHLRDRGLISGYGKTLRAVVEPPPTRKPTQAERVLEAVRRGFQHAPEIAKEAGVPLPNVHPLLNLLRRRGHIEGYAGNLRFLQETPLPPHKQLKAPPRRRNGPHDPARP